MKHYIKNITWKFKDSAEEYPQLKDRRIKITDPQTIFDNFRFCLMEKLKNGSLSFG